METIILFAPLVGASDRGFGWKLIGESRHSGSLRRCCFWRLSSWVVFLTFDGVTEHIQILRWIESGTLSTDWAIRMDRLTAIMLIVITTVSSLVHLYSFGYMAHDENFERAKAITRAFLCLSVVLHLCDVDAGDSRQPCSDVLWLGRCGRCVISVDRFLLQQTSRPMLLRSRLSWSTVSVTSALRLGSLALFYLTDSIKFDDIFAAAPELAEHAPCISCGLTGTRRT